MSSVLEIRDGLRDRLNSISGLIAHDVIPNVITLPCAVVVPRRWDYEHTMGRGGDPARYFFEVWLLLSAGDVAGNQDTLDRLLTASSTGGVFGAIAADRTLGGRAITTYVDGGREYEVREYAAMEVLTATLDVEVWSS